MDKQQSIIEQPAITAEHPIMGAALANSQNTLLRDFLLYAIKGISMYAHRTRQLSVTDREIDVATVEMIQKALSGGDLDVFQLAEILRRAKQVRHRAKTLYEWACGPWARKPEDLQGPAALELETDPQNLILQAQVICGDLRQGGPSCHTNVILEKLCKNRLRKTAERAILGASTGKADDKLYAFCHEVLDFLSKDPTTEELAIFSRRIEEEHLHYVN